MTPSFIGRIAVMLPGRAAEHLLGGETDFLDHALAVGPAVLPDRDHRRLVEDDALAADIDQRVGRTEVDREIVREIALQKLEHRMGPLENLKKAVRRWDAWDGRAGRNNRL
jgi:hypothetical protein